MEIQEGDIVRVVEEHWSLPVGKCIRVARIDHDSEEQDGDLLTKTDLVEAGPIVFDYNLVEKIT